MTAPAADRAGRPLARLVGLAVLVAAALSIHDGLEPLGNDRRPKPWERDLDRGLAALLARTDDVTHLAYLTDRPTSDRNRRQFVLQYALTPIAVSAEDHARAAARRLRAGHVVLVDAAGGDPAPLLAELEGAWGRSVPPGMPPGLTRRPAGPGRVLARAGDLPPPAAGRPSPSRAPPRPSATALVVLALGVALGRAALAGARASAVEILGHATWIGPAAVSAALFVVRDRALSFWTGTAVLAAGAAAAWLATTGRRREPGPARRPRLAVAVWLLAATIAVLCAGDWRAERPGGLWDGMAIWNTQARTLARATDELPDVLARRVLGHPDYPLLLPATIAAQWLWRGDESAGVPRDTALLLLLGLGLATAAATSRWTSPAAGALTGALVLVVPVALELARAQVADTAVALLLLAAVSSLAAALDDPAGGRRRAWLGGTAAGLLPWVKNEGAVLAAVVVLGLLATAVVTTGRRRLVAGVAWRALAGALPAVGLVAAFKIGWAPPDPLLDDLGRTLASLLDAGRWRAALAGFGAQLTDIARWGPTWPLVGLLSLLAAAGARRGRPLSPALVFWRLAVAGALGAYLLIYVATPVRQGQAWHIETSLWRLLFQITPALLVLAVVLAARAAGGGGAAATAGSAAASAPPRR